MPWSSSQSPIWSSRSDVSSAVSSCDLGLGDLLGDLVLDADQDAQRLGGELAVGQHRQLVPHLADALAQVGHRAGGGRRRVVELVGQAGGDGAQRQQLLALADDLALPQAADHVPLEQMHGHRELATA